jgi:hypothetical protein
VALSNDVERAVGTRGAWQTAIAVVLLYAALVAVLTWPLAARLRTDLPDTRWICGFDSLCTAWVLGWESHALATGAPLADANIYHPTTGTLYYGNTAFGALPFYLPTFLLSGNPTLALNVLLLAGAALTAAALHLVAFRWTRSHATAFLAGWSCLMTPWTLWTFTPTSPDEGILPYLPFVVLFAADVRPRVGALVAVAVAQSLVDPAYMAVATLTPVVLLGVFRLLRPDTREGGRRLLAAAALTTLALLPIDARHFAVRAGVTGSTLKSLWTPLTLAMLPLPWAENQPTGAPIAVAVLVAVGLLTRPRTAAARVPGWGPAAFWAVTGLVLMLPPMVDVGGATVALPNALLARWTPLYQVLREPSRLGVASLVGVALLAAVAAEEVARRLPTGARRLVPLAVAVAMFAQYAWDGTRLPGRYPLVPAPSDEEPILAVLRQPGGPLLELPIGHLEAGATGHARAMFRSTRHWRPLLNGYGSYFPATFADRMDVALQLPDAVAVAKLRDEAGLALLLVHLDEFDLTVRNYCRHLPGHGVGRPACARDLGAPSRALWEKVAADGRSDLRLLVRSGPELLFAVGP